MRMQVQRQRIIDIGLSKRSRVLLKEIDNDLKFKRPKISQNKMINMKQID